MMRVGGPNGTWRRLWMVQRWPPGRHQVRIYTKLIIMSSSELSDLK